MASLQTSTQWQMSSLCTKDSPECPLTIYIRDLRAILQLTTKHSSSNLLSYFPIDIIQNLFKLPQQDISEHLSEEKTHFLPQLSTSSHQSTLPQIPLQPNPQTNPHQRKNGQLQQQSCT